MEAAVIHRLLIKLCGGYILFLHRIMKRETLAVYKPKV